MIERYSNSLLSDVIEYLPDPTFAIDRYGKVIAWNRAIEKMTGTLKEDIIDKGDYAHAKPFYGERRPCLVELIRDAKSEFNSYYDFIHRVENKLYAEVFVPSLNNNKGAYLGITASSLINGKGQEYGAIEYIRDITEQKKEEIQFNKNEHRFKSVIESAADVIVTSDTNGNILYCNKSIKNIFGYTMMEVLGKNVTSLMADKYKDKQTDEFHFKIHEEYLKEYNPIKITGLKKDGSEFPFEVSVSSWKFAENNYFTFIIRDITRREMDNEALRVSEAKYKAFFESDPDYAILIDQNGIIADVNESAMHISGLSRGELVGTFFKDLNIFPEEELIVHQKIFSKVLRQERITPYEARIINKDGTLRWVLNSSTTLMKDDKISYVLVIGSDITKRKNAEIELKSSLKEKEVLLREIHHRVKNNLQIISSLLNLQEAYVKEDPVAINVLRESQNRVLSMSMIHEMLYQSNNISAINFQGYIRNLISNLLDSYGCTEYITDIDIENTMLNIETSIPVGLIISELVSNSLKYAYPNEEVGKITLSLESQDNEYKLIVGDDGVGFPPEFDFRNVEDTLGLRLVNSLVEQIDGYIDLDKTHGTQFTIKFHEQQYNKRI